MPDGPECQDSSTWLKGKSIVLSSQYRNVVRVNYIQAYTPTPKTGMEYRMSNIIIVAVELGHCTHKYLNSNSREKNTNRVQISSLGSCMLASIQSHAVWMTKSRTPTLQIKDLIKHLNWHHNQPQENLVAIHLHKAQNTHLLLAGGLRILTCKIFS